MIPDRHPLPERVSSWALASLEVPSPAVAAFHALGVTTAGALLERLDADFLAACVAAGGDEAGRAAFSHTTAILANLGGWFGKLRRLSVSIDHVRPSPTAQTPGMVPWDVEGLPIRALRLVLPPDSHRRSDPLMSTWTLPGGEVHFQIRPTTETPDLDSMVSASQIEGTAVKGEWGALLDTMWLSPRGRVVVTFYDARLCAKAIAEVVPHPRGTDPKPQLRKLARDLALSMVAGPSK